MFVEFGFVSGRVRRSRVCAGTFSSKSPYFGTRSARSCYSRDVFDEVFLVSGRVRKGVVSVGSCSARFS